MDEPAYLAKVDKDVAREEITNAVVALGKGMTGNKIFGPAQTGVGAAQAAAEYSLSIMPQLENDCKHWQSTGDHRPTYAPNLKLTWEKVDQGDWRSTKDLLKERLNEMTEAGKK